MTHRHDQMLRNDPALAEALAGWRDRPRLSDEAARALIARRRRTVTGAALAAVAVLAAVGVTSRHAEPDRTVRIATARGQVRAVRLPDGTTMRLDGATRLAVRWGPRTRAVTLADGAVRFDVAHDPARPFVVHARDGEVRVLGTAFAIDRTAGRMELMVYRGAVRLAGRGDAVGERVSAGWRSSVVRGHAAPPHRVDARADDAHWLDVDGLRLADLVSILDRRSRLPILPPPAALADLPVSGRFRIDDPLDLLTSLGAANGFSVKDRGDRLELSRN